MPGIVFKGATDYHKDRRFLLTNLKSRGMGRSGLEGQILEEVEQLINHLTTNKELDPRVLLTNFTSNTIMTMCFEKRWEYGDENYTRFADSIEKIVETFPLVMLKDLVPLFGYLPSVAQGNKENYKANSVLRSQFEGLIRERVHSKDSHTSFDIVGDYMNKNKVENEEEIKNLIDLCQTMFFAGSDTTSSTTNWTIVHLLSDLAWQEEVYTELSRVLEGRAPTMAGLQDLPKMEATIAETLRLSPVNPLILKANCETAMLRDYIIPANTMIMINVYHINRDPQVFPDPGAFHVL